jgi:DNA transposition AAA+ family ATPase
MSNELAMRKDLQEYFDERLADMRESRDWQDDLHEIADSFVSVYTTERVKQWLALGCPEVEDTGLIEGVSDVSQIIAVAIYEWACGELYEMAQEAGLE